MTTTQQAQHDGSTQALAGGSASAMDASVVLIDRRVAARRVFDLNKQLDMELLLARIGVTEGKRESAGRRADDVQENLLAIRRQFPDLCLAECNAAGSGREWVAPVVRELTEAERLQYEHGIDIGGRR